MEWRVESMHWLLDVHFNEDKTRVFDMNVQRLLNDMRKIVLNMIRIYRDANFSKTKPLNSILKDNLFDPQVLSQFLTFFSKFENLQQINM